MIKRSRKNVSMWTGCRLWKMEMSRWAKWMRHWFSWWKATKVLKCLPVCELPLFQNICLGSRENANLRIISILIINWLTCLKSSEKANCPWWGEWKYFLICAVKGFLSLSELNVLKKERNFPQHFVKTPSSSVLKNKQADVTTFSISSLPLFTKQRQEDFP